MIGPWFRYNSCSNYISIIWEKGRGDLLKQNYPKNIINMLPRNIIHITVQNVYLIHFV